MIAKNNIVSRHKMISRHRIISRNRMKSKANTKSMAANKTTTTKRLVYIGFPPMRIMNLPAPSSLVIGKNFFKKR